MPDTYPALFWGYSVIWALLVSALIVFFSRMRKMESRLAELEAELLNK